MIENASHAAIVGDPTFASSGETTSGVKQGRDLQGKDLINRVAESAHGAVDRLAEKAGPAVEKIESGVAHASETMSREADYLRELGDEWTHTIRDSVRENPLTAVLVAVAAGAVISRLTR